jgi:carboxymethylenebutenolidase
MPEYLPFPYPVPNAGGNPGTKYEYRVPVTGIETAAKMRDRNAVPSNEMFDFKVREVQQDSEGNKRNQN